MQVFPAGGRITVEHSQFHLVPTAGTLAHPHGIGVPGTCRSSSPARATCRRSGRSTYVSGFAPDAVPPRDVVAVIFLARVRPESHDHVRPHPVARHRLAKSRIDGMSQSTSRQLPAFKARLDASRSTSASRVPSSASTASSRPADRTAAPACLGMVMARPLMGGGMVSRGGGVERAGYRARRITPSAAGRSSSQLDDNVVDFDSRRVHALHRLTRGYDVSVGEGGALPDVCRTTGAAPLDRAINCTTRSRAQASSASTDQGRRC